jgi:thiosulfate/3-mercaptopyruvate sulfurtransferase
MKLRYILKLALLLCVLSFNKNSFAQNPENWTKDQLMQPADLAKIVEAGKDLPVILSVGPGAYIPHSVNIGMTKDKENLDKLKRELKTLPKNKKIVVYCGCCPFDHCPNVRPAIKMLKDMKFTNYQLLNLEHNIKTDWIDKGYPEAE